MRYINSDLTVEVFFIACCQTSNLKPQTLQFKHFKNSYLTVSVFLIANSQTSTIKSQTLIYVPLRCGLLNQCILKQKVTFDRDFYYTTKMTMS